MLYLLRIAAVAVAGAVLYEAGLVNGATQLRPSAAGALFTVAGVASAFALTIVALRGRGQGEGASTLAPSLVVPARVAFLLVSFMALVGLAWLRGVPAPPVEDETSYHNDAIALNECAAQEVLRGRDPYAQLDLYACYGERRIGGDRTTPLRRGSFATVTVYPSEEEMDAAWAAREDVFVWRPSYPALSIALILPWVALGWDTNVLYLLCLVAAMALVAWRAPRGSRGFVITGLFAAASLTAFTVGGSADLLYALPLVAAWLWRERRWSAVALGIACAVKQLAWPFAAFYLIGVVAARGWREALRRAAAAAGVFALANAPFVLWDARAWWLGLITPVAEPMFARGAGLVFLSTNGVLPLGPPGLYLVLEGLAAVAVLAVGWRSRHTSPELGAVLAMTPFFFAWRSLFSYFFLLPLFALAGLARMPAGEVSTEAARSSGALTVLALPTREGSAPRS